MRLTSALLLWPFFLPAPRFKTNGFSILKTIGPRGTGNDPRGPSSGSYRASRGGLWDGVARFCRVACRDDYGPASYGSDFIGFRSALPSGQWAKLVGQRDDDNGLANLWGEANMPSCLTLVVGRKPDGKPRLT